MIINSPVLLVIWVLASLIIGIMGARRKLGFAVTFLLSLILSPLIGLIIMIASDPKKDRTSDAN